ncbi:MAG: hypothetical protein D6722_01280 [Bacteroidetes bacterium]|nr:MAG: hypothetical protein D6722_01280 [Bacteroidota bacterium]
MHFFHHQLDRFCQQAGYPDPARLRDELDRLFPETRDSDLNRDPAVQAYVADQVIPHKLAVYAAGMSLAERLTVPDDWAWQLARHDLSKLSVLELTGYVAYNFKDRASNPPAVKQAFAVAFLHHKHHNAHHSGHWLSLSSSGSVQALPMPRRYLVEMLADWMGASLSYSGNSDIQPWLDRSLPGLVLHPDSRRDLAQILREAGYDPRGLG